jgi:hypothetical protein
MQIRPPNRTADQACALLSRQAMLFFSEVLHRCYASTTKFPKRSILTIAQRTRSAILAKLACRRIETPA